MNVIGRDEIHSKLWLVQLMSLLTIGTTLRVRVKDCNTIWQHKICDARGVLEFLQKMNKINGRHLMVHEISSFSGDSIDGIEVYCI